MERSDAEISRALRSAMRKRYPAPAWCLLEEVRDRTGFNSKRSADAIAMATWESHGLELHGFELKASRGDWMRERKRPDKADTIARFVDRWWLVVGDADVVRDGELPPTWGLLVLGKGDQLRVARQAERRESTPVDRGFLAAMLRRAVASASERIHPDDLEETVTKRVEELLAAERRAAPFEERRYHQLYELHRKMLNALGLHVYDATESNLPSIAKAYEIVARADRKAWYRDELARARQSALDAAKRTAELIKEIDELGAAVDPDAAVAEHDVEAGA